MDKVTAIQTAFNTLKSKGLVRSQKDFAILLNFSEGAISRALKGDEKYLTDSLLARINQVMDEPAFPFEKEQSDIPPDSVLLPLIPTEAMAGTLVDFATSVQAYECERIISPIKGADYAMKVCGDSMSPEYPNGCQILIKRINADAFIEWGKVYVLDTENGAVIKKVRRTDDENLVECMSINPEYQSFLVNRKHIFGWYRVLMVMCLK